MTYSINPKMTTVRRRILLVLTAIAATMLIVLAIMQRFENKQAMTLANHDCDESARYFGKLIELNSSSLESLDFDNSYWDDMVAFVQHPSTQWASRNIDAIIDPSKVDGMWVYSKQGALIYSATTPDIARLRTCILPKVYIAALARRHSPTHVFVKYGSRVIEIYGNTIVPSNDQAHASQPAGYLLTGRLWDQEYIDKLAVMTAAAVSLLPAGSDTTRQDQSTDGNKITFSEGCFDWTGKEIGRLQLQTFDPTFVALRSSSDKLLVYLAIFGALLILSVSMSILIWVTCPIEKIVTALKEERPQMLDSLLKTSTEFGTIARLVDDFVSQQQELRNARDYLEIIIQERTHELEEANARLTRSYEAVIAGWGRALDLRDHETEGHCLRVTEMTLRLAKLFGFDEEELMHIERGALLHDIGKMGVPDNILLKSGPLTDEERELMQKHCVYAYEMLYPIEFLRPALDIPYCHHEKWDGTGYPRGLKGEEIPLAARIFAIADVSDALSSDRPYRAAWSVQRVRDHIRKLSGSHFDPRVTEAYLAETIGDEDIKIDFGDHGGPSDLRLAA